MLVQASHSDAETDWYLDLAEANDFLAGVVGWVDLQSDGLFDRLDELQRRPKFVGVRHVVQAEPDDDWLLRPAVLAGLEELERRGLTYDLLLLPRHLRHVPVLAERLPGLKMVIDHLAKPLIASGVTEPWKTDLAAAAAYSNVYAKLSGLVTEADHNAWTIGDLAPYARHAVDCFGFDRLMFGSDWPVCLLAADHARVVSSLVEALPPLTPAQHRRLFAGTAEAFYGLASAAPGAPGASGVRPPARSPQSW